MSENPPAAPAAEAPAGLPPLGEILSAATKVVIDRPGLFLTLWVATGLPALVMTVGSAYWLGLGDRENFKVMIEAGQWRPLALFGLVALVGKALEMVGFTAAVLAAADCAAGREPETGHSLEGGLARFPAVVWTAVVVAVRVLLGLLLLIIPGVILMALYGFSHLAATLEGLSGGAAARRSWQLIAGNFWKVMGNTLVFTLIAGAGAIMVALGGGLLEFAAAAAAGKGAGLLVDAATKGVGSLIGAWASAASVLLYLALAARTPKETA